MKYQRISWEIGWWCGGCVTLPFLQQPSELIYKDDVNGFVEYLLRDIKNGPFNWFSFCCLGKDDIKTFLLFNLPRTELRPKRNPLIKKVENKAWLVALELSVYDSLRGCASADGSWWRGVGLLVWVFITVYLRMCGCEASSICQIVGLLSRPTS